MRRVYMPRHIGLGPSRVRTRIPSTRRLSQWASLRKILRFHVRQRLYPQYSVVAPLFSWRLLVASTSFFHHAAMHLRSPSVTVSL